MKLNIFMTMYIVRENNERWRRQVTPLKTKHLTIRRIDEIVLLDSENITFRRDVANNKFVVGVICKIKLN